ncbi:MAG: XTP/dITP diphosphatase [Chloroflexota bacterium]|nr:MAG: XTP/dITP diphosphatase [Chloroflexota bacterium]
MARDSLELSLYPELLLGTNNQAKIREYRSLLTDLDQKLVTLTEQGISVEVDEAGDSLEENARLKAAIIAEKSQMLTLADDSGLEVDALGGEPGRLSARYAGENASDAERIAYLLKRMNGVPREKRAARFRCVIALATPAGKVKVCSGECPGFITLEPRGEYGFGYDPIFYLPELGKTVAELPLEQKNRISHRGQAARKAVKALKSGEL